MRRCGRDTKWDSVWAKMSNDTLAESQGLNDGIKGSRAVLQGRADAELPHQVDRSSAWPQIAPRPANWKSQRSELCNKPPVFLSTLSMKRSRVCRCEGYLAAGRDEAAGLSSDLVCRAPRGRLSCADQRFDIDLVLSNMLLALFAPGAFLAQQSDGREGSGERELNKKSKAGIAA